MAIQPFQLFSDWTPIIWTYLHMVLVGCALVEVCMNTGQKYEYLQMPIQTLFFYLGATASATTLAI